MKVMQTGKQSIFQFNSISIVTGWNKGYSFILSFLAPLWTIGQSSHPDPYFLVMAQLIGYFDLGAFDSSVHISEEVTNASTAVPWAIVNSIGIAGVLGFGMSYVKIVFLEPTDLEAQQLI